MLQGCKLQCIACIRCTSFDEVARLLSSLWLNLNSFMRYLTCTQPHIPHLPVLCKSLIHIKLHICIWHQVCRSIIAVGRMYMYLYIYLTSNVPELYDLFLFVLVAPIHISSQTTSAVFAQRIFMVPGQS